MRVVSQSSSAVAHATIIRPPVIIVVVSITTIISVVSVSAVTIPRVIAALCRREQGQEDSHESGGDDGREKSTFVSHCLTLLTRFLDVGDRVRTSSCVRSAFQTLPSGDTR